MSRSRVGERGVNYLSYHLTLYLIRSNIKTLQFSFSKFIISYI